MKTTLEEYDEIPCEDGPVAVTRPDFLAVVGRIFGLRSAPPDSCRVLEFGCASGGNLIPLAYYWMSATMPCLAGVCGTPLHHVSVDPASFGCPGCGADEAHH